MNRLRTIDAQARLNHWYGTKLAVDGMMGPKTRSALAAAGGLAALKHHRSGLIRIVLHWTAGAEGVIALERRHYHAIIGQDGKTYLGNHRPEANGVIRGQYAAHTRGLNTGSIGVALDAMAGAREVPFDAGSNPITGTMVDALCETVADMCETYSIPVTPWTVLTHAEVQGTLGVRQRNKWDITWLPGMDKPGDAVEVGNILRAKITEELAVAA